MARSYEALTSYLVAQSNPVVELSFTELDRLVEGGLPPSARRYQAWWANSRVSQRHSTYWLDAGRQASPDFNAGRVRFTFGGETRRGPNRRSVGGRRTRTPVATVSSAGGPVSVASLDLTGETTVAAVKLRWLDGGAVTLRGGKPTMAGLPPSPGVYRFELVDGNGQMVAVYVGETDNLARRMGQYRNPGSRQRTNLRLRDLLVEHLTGGGTARLRVATEVEVNQRLAEMADRPVRLLGENAALVTLSGQGHHIVNHVGGSHSAGED